MARNLLTKRVWQYDGAPVDGVNGTYAGHEWLEPGDLLTRISAGAAALFQNTNTKASPTWTQFTSGGVTLDGAYDYGGAGAGKAVTVDSGAIALTNNAANNNGILTLNKSPVGAQSGDALTITMGAQASGAAIVLANSGSGNDITGTAGWSVTKAGVITADSASIGQVTLAEDTLPAATNCYIGRDNTGDVTINALVGKSVHLAIAGTDVLDVAGAAITLRQAVTISTGGLTVSAGGVTVTGNSTITGDLAVTGSLTFGGNWTVGATLTVDELILDTDGVQPAGTNCYAVRDNNGDLTVNAITGKQFIIAVNNTDEYTFSATILDFNGNAADNVGFLILNAATAPAGTEVYLVNDNTGDLTLNALTGKGVYIALAGTDEAYFLETGFVYNDASADRNFRVETNNMQYAIYSDGGKDSLVLGSNTDTSSVDQLIRVSRAARSNTAATNYFDLVIESAGAITTTGVTAIVATAYINEPNITIGADSVTVAAALYVAGEPSEGGSNYGIACAASIGLIADAKDLAIGASADCLLRWSTADADNHALALGLGASLAFHICQAADIATDWNVAAASNPTLYIHGATTPATEYVAISTDETDAHLNAVGANWKFEIGGTAELTLAANALNLVDSLLYGSAASHTADTADACLYLHSTSHATKGFVVIPDAQLGLIIGSDGSVDRAGTVGTNALHIFNGTAPVGALANGISIYANAGEGYMMDAAGNATLQTPHSPDGDYIIYSYSAAKKQTVTIHLEKMLRKLAEKFPADFASLMEVDDGFRHYADKVRGR